MLASYGLRSRTLEVQEARTPEPVDRGGLGAAWLAAGILQTVALFLIVVAMARPPRVVPASGPPEAFSAERAMGTLERLLNAAAAGAVTSGTAADGLHPPHPAGSPANAALRDLLLVELDALGLETEVQRRMVCNPEGVCAEVENVLGRLAGPVPAGTPGVLLVAHYDSVAAGPGAGDDLSGVACILEVLRAFLTDPGLAAFARPDAPPLMVLFSDAEELGLLGARAFAEHHPWMQDVAVVVNLEARGTSGGSLLFETGPDNAWLLELYARAAPRPSATSYSVELYRAMPNDTDFTPFREAGVAGVNFAFIEDVHDYHTRNDSLERLDPRSLQHHGENVLPLVRALAQADLTATPEGDLVYSDLFSRTVLSWPARWCLPILLVLLGLLVVGVVRARRLCDVPSVTASALRALSAVLFVALVGEAVGSVLSIGDGPVGALHPLPPWGAYAAVVTLALVWLGGRARSPGSAVLGLATLWAALAAAFTFLAPGASHLFTLPLAPLLVVLALRPRLASPGRSGARGVLLIVTCALTTLIWSPLLHGVAHAFGLRAGGALAVGMAAHRPVARPASPGPVGLRRVESYRSRRPSSSPHRSRRDSCCRASTPTFRATSPSTTSWTRPARARSCSRRCRARACRVRWSPSSPRRRRTSSTDSSATWRPRRTRSTSRRRSSRSSRISARAIGVASSWSCARPHGRS